MSFWAPAKETESGRRKGEQDRGAKCGMMGKVERIKVDRWRVWDKRNMNTEDRNTCREVYRRKNDRQT